MSKRFLKFIYALVSRFRVFLEGRSKLIVIGREGGGAWYLLINMNILLKDHFLFHFLKTIYYLKEYTKFIIMDFPPKCHILILRKI